MTRPSSPERPAGGNNSRETRRDEVLRSASRVIMRQGLGGTSMRRIAREGGFTTGVLTHYFVDKRELILACFEWQMSRFLDDAAARLARCGSAEEHVDEFVRTAVPIDRARHDEWRLWFEAYGAAISDQGAAEALVRVERRWEETIAQAVALWQREGLVRADLDHDAVGLRLARLIDGLCLRALAGGSWDEARAGLVQELQMLGLPSAHAAQLLAEPAEGDR